MSQKNILCPSGIFLILLCCTLLFTGENKIDPDKAEASQNHTLQIHVPQIHSLQIHSLQIHSPQIHSPQIHSPQDHSPQIRTPVADGTIVYESELVSVDASHTDEGYVMIRYMGNNAKVKLQLQISGGQTYTYLLSRSQTYETFPFSSGDGNYSLRIYEHVKNSLYTLIYARELTITLRNEFLPFLYPNQYVSFTPDSLTAATSKQLCADTCSNAEAIGILYRYVCRNISYDMEKAAYAAYGYLPDVDEILTSKKGICFDYAAVLTAMLRSRGIPAKLEIGYADGVYHAWVSVYSEESGWLEGGGQLRKKNWNLLDPTLAAHGGNLNAYTGDGNHYVVKYSY